VRQSKIPSRVRRVRDGGRAIRDELEKGDYDAPKRRRVINAEPARASVGQLEV